MRHTPLLPLAPRPYADELISSWQARVAVRYSQRSADIDAWLDLDSPTHKDLDPDPISLWRWTRACRIRPDVVEALALSRHAAPLGYVRQARWRGICPTCLEGDRRNGRDQYIRRSWSRSEVVACLLHRVRLRFSCWKCFTRCDFRFEYWDGLAELICSDCMAAVSRAPPAPCELRHANLLIATMEAIDDAEKGRGGPDLAEFEKAIQFLWSDSTNSGKPEITFFNVQSTPGPASIPVNAAAPLTCLSMTWRSNTLLTIAQMLDIGSAQSDLGPPSDWLTLAYQRFRSKVADEPSLPERPKAKPHRVALSLRPNADYLRLAVETMKDPLRRELVTLGARDRSKALSRLARDLLSSAEAQIEKPHP